MKTRKPSNVILGFIFFETQSSEKSVKLLDFRVSVEFDLRWSVWYVSRFLKIDVCLISMSFISFLLPIRLIFPLHIETKYNTFVGIIHHLCYIYLVIDLNCSQIVSKFEKTEAWSNPNGNTSQCLNMTIYHIKSATIIKKLS